MATVTKTLPIPGSKSTPRNKTRASISFDPANPNAPKTLTVTSIVTNKRGRTTSSSDATYTQGADGMFRNSAGTLWEGEYDKGGGLVRQSMGKTINAANVNDATIDKWGADATGLNKKEKEGGSVADGKDKGTTTTVPQSKRNTPQHNKNHGNLRYPLTLLKNTDFMKITTYKYVPGGLKHGNRPSERAKTPLGNVILPIPPGLTDANSVSWGDHTMNAVQMFGANEAKKAMGADDPTKAIADTVTKAMEVARNDPNSKNVMQNYLLSQVSALGATTNQLSARDSGQILNPNLELLFGGPTLRSFSYSFRLTARSSRESETIVKIIRMFKQSMAVQGGATGVYLESPNIFQVEFFDGKGKPHRFINKLKMAAMTSFNVNYVPDGTYMTYDNSAMTAYEIQLGLQETEPIISTDYTGDGIGF